MKTETTYYDEKWRKVPKFSPVDVVEAIYVYEASKIKDPQKAFSAGVLSQFIKKYYLIVANKDSGLETSYADERIIEHVSETIKELGIDFPSDMLGFHKKIEEFINGKFPIRVTTTIKE